MPTPRFYNYHGRRRWLDAATFEPDDRHFLGFECSKRSCSKGFRPTDASRPGMMLLNTRTGEIIRITKKGRIHDSPHRKTLHIAAWADRGMEKGEGPQERGQTIHHGDTWILLGLEERLATVLREPNPPTPETEKQPTAGPACLLAGHLDDIIVRLERVSQRLVDTTDRIEL